MVDQSDAAFRYVQAANRAEMRRAAARNQPREPSVRLNIAVAAVLFWVATTHWATEDRMYSAIFVVLGSFNAITAYRTWHKRSVTQARHADDV